MSLWLWLQDERYLYINEYYDIHFGGSCAYNDATSGMFHVIMMLYRDSSGYPGAPNYLPLHSFVIGQGCCHGKVKNLVFFLFAKLRWLVNL